MTYPFNIDSVLAAEDPNRAGIEKCLKEISECRAGSRKFNKLKEAYDGFILNFYQKGVDKRVIIYYSEELARRTKSSAETFK